MNMRRVCEQGQQKKATCVRSGGVWSQENAEHHHLKKPSAWAEGLMELR
jgi:hypothetical protein